MSSLLDPVRPESRPLPSSDLEPRRAYQRGLVLIVILYLAISGSILLATHGLPYVMDNNESFSALRHARNLALFDISKSYGATDESYANEESGHPFVHTHQGNWPRLFAYIIYRLGATTIESQIVVTAFTIGLLSIFLVYHFFAKVAQPLFATVMCVVLLTHYVGFTQWHFVTYRVWHCLFLFGALLCAHGLQRERKRWVLAGTVLLYAALFYYELIFVGFVSLFAAGYTAFLHRRSLRTIVTGWMAQAAGGTIGLGIHFTQIVAYLGWNGLVRDIHYTFAARNAGEGSGGASVLEMRRFFLEHRIVFWENFQDGSLFRTLSKLVNSVSESDLQLWTPPLAMLSLVFFLAWVGANLNEERQRLLNRNRAESAFDRRIAGLIALTCLPLIGIFALRLADAAVLGVPLVLMSCAVILVWMGWVSLGREAWSAGRQKLIEFAIRSPNEPTRILRFVSTVAGAPMLILAASWVATAGDQPITLAHRVLLFGFFLLTVVTLFVALQPVIALSLLSRSKQVCVQIAGTEIPIERDRQASVALALIGTTLALAAVAYVLSGLQVVTMAPAGPAELSPAVQRAVVSLLLGAFATVLIAWMEGGSRDSMSRISVERWFRAAMLAVVAAVLFRGQTLFNPGPGLVYLWQEQLQGWFPAAVNRAGLFAAVVFICRVVVEDSEGEWHNPLSRLRPVFAFFVCGVVAYGIIYFLSPGYMLTGYQFRNLSPVVSLAALAVAVPIYLLTLRVLAVGRPWDGHLFQRRFLISRRGADLMLAGGLLVFFLAFWAFVQIKWVILLPPDHFSILRKLRQEPYRNKTFITDNYAAPVSEFTRQWSYLDLAVPADTVALTDKGYEMERDLRQLWFADGTTNPRYLWPDYFICTVMQSPGMLVSKIAQHRGLPQYRGCLSENIVQHALAGLPRPLSHKMVEWDEEGQSKDGVMTWAIVKLDWVFPPYLLPVEGASAHRPVGISVKQRSGADPSHRYTISYSYVYAQQNGDPERSPTVELLSYGQSPDCTEFGGEPEVLANSEGAPFKLPADFEGKIAVRLTPRSSRKSGTAFYSSIVAIDPRSPSHLQACTVTAEEEPTPRPKLSRQRPEIIEVGWPEMAEADYYQVEVAPEGEKFVMAGETPRGSPNFLISKLNNLVTYEVRIRGCSKDHSCSTVSQIATAGLTPPYLGEIPEQLMAVRSSSGAIDLNWKGVAGAYLYTVEAAFDDTSFVPLGSVAGNHKSYTMFGSSLGHKFVFRVKACTEKGWECTPYSEEVGVDLSRRSSE